MLLVTVPIILDQAVGYSSYFLGSGCWLLFPIIWTSLLVTIPIALDQFVGYRKKNKQSKITKKKNKQKQTNKQTTKNKNKKNERKKKRKEKYGFQKR
jgi:uncharacterized membrane protein